MEDYLDAISRHEVEHLQYLREFFLGDNGAGLKQRIEEKIKEVDARDISRFSLGKPETGEHRDEVVLRVGKFGPFLEQGERRASIPHDLPPDELTLDKAVDLLDKGQREDEPLGYCPETNRPVYLKTGRFGPYVQLGAVEEKQKPKNASLMKNMSPEDVDLETALKLLALPRTVGEHPESKEPIVAHNGRYGPFIKCGEETRSLPAELSPLDVTRDQALELLAQPKTRGRRRAAPKEPLKVYGSSPVTDEPVRLLDGRYGAYITDGTTNVTLPKDTTADEITLEKALELLAERAAKGPTRKKKAAKKKTTKKTAKKKAAKKKATKKQSES
jgi:DNA topoisomerase-1